MYLIDNTTEVGLLLRHGDLLGAFYTGPHYGIRAERAYMLIAHYNELIADQNRYWLDVETAVEDYYQAEEEGCAHQEDEPTLDETVEDNKDTMPSLEKLNVN